MFHPCFIRVHPWLNNHLTAEEKWYDLSEYPVKIRTGRSFDALPLAQDDNGLRVSSQTKESLPLPIHSFSPANSQ